MQKINGVIEFTNGKVINFELYPEIAPISVDNFCALCKTGFYNGLCFHRVIPNFMIQGGGYVAKNGALKPKNAPKNIKGEFLANGVNNPLGHSAGVFSMARTSVPDSASSQFFICVNDVPYLDGQYAAFGKVTDQPSLKTAIDISKVKTFSQGGFDDIPVTPVEIKTIRIL